MKASPRPSPKERGKKPPLKPSAFPSRKNERLFSFIIFAFAFLLYANTLNHGYALDDDVVYLKNKDVQSGFSGIKSILNHSFIYGFTGHNDQSYRPVVLILYAIENELFGNKPSVGHFINVLLFALSCVLLYKLLNALFRNSVTLVPLAAALLFAAHPVHTEAVANIKGRDDILNFIFLVLSLLFVLKHIDSGGKRNFILSVLFFFLSLLCKEMAVTFLAIIPLTVFFFRDVPVKRIITGMISFIGVFGVYMLIRSSVLDAVTFEEKMKVVNNGLAAATNGSDRIATALLILGKYILLLFYPHPLSWDYSFNQIPIVSFSNIKVIGTFLIFVVAGIYSIAIVLKRMKSPRPPLQGGERSAPEIFAYCILFFFLTMSVVSNIFIMIGATMGERFLFVPSVAFCLGVSFFLFRLGNRSNTGNMGHTGNTRSNAISPISNIPLITLLPLAVILLLFSYKTYSRNPDWKDNFSLFLSGLEAAPNSSRAQSALGSSYREQAEVEKDMVKRGNLYGKAIEQYMKAVKILPENTEALYNLGVCYYAIGDRENALRVYENTLKFTPEHTNAANNLGVIYFERKDYEPAKKYFLQAIQYAPANSDALGNLGAIEHNLGNLPQAIDYYRRALAINPGNQNVRGNLAKAEETLKARSQSK